MKSTTTPRLLLLATTTGYQTQAFAEAAPGLGLEVVLGTDRCHVLEDPWQDAALPLRFEDPAHAADEICHYAREHPIQAVAAVGDKPTVTAAVACRALGIPWHSPQGAEACHNKFLARQRFEEAGLNVPAYACYSCREGPPPADGGSVSCVPFPCVLKPVSLAASRGVIRADNPEQFAAAFHRIAALLASPEIQVKKEAETEQILVEEFVPGSEFAVEGLMWQGRLRVLAIFDKPDPLEGPYFEETIYVTPSRLPVSEQAALTGCLERAVRALGLFHGPVHAEFRLNDRGPWVLDVAARPIGGLCSRALRFGSGMSLEELVILNALGRRNALSQRNARGELLDGIARESAAAGVMMIPIPGAGVFEGVEGVEDALRVPGVEEVHVTAKLHQKLVPWPEGASYPGFLFARASSPAAVEEALREAHRRLRFRISPMLAVV